MKSMLQGSGAKRLKLNLDKLPSSFAFSINLRRYTKHVKDGPLSAEEKAAKKEAKEAQDFLKALPPKDSPVSGADKAPVSEEAKTAKKLEKDAAKVGRCRLFLSNPR
jgi:hypothetical protein